MAYEGYTFECSFESGISVELCQNGASQTMRKNNAESFVNLYLQKFTEQDALQFERVFLAIQDCVGTRMLSHLDPKAAQSRACSQPEITVDAFRSVIDI